MELNSIFAADQISRATYLDICMLEESQIETMTDSLEKESAMNRLMDEKMDFFSAVERGAIVLGDTLLHVAVRLAHEPVVDFLLLTDHPALDPAKRSTIGNTSATAPAPACANTTQTPNFKGELPKDVVGSHRVLQLLLENVADVHEAFGFAYKEEPKVHRMVRCLRTIWPLWMFDGQQETASLVRVVYDARSSDAAFGKLVKVTVSISDRFRTAVSKDGLLMARRLMQQHNGDIHAARQAVAKEWTPDQKRKLLFEIFHRWFGAWQWKRHDERDQAYVEFFDSAMDAWLQIVDDMHLHHEAQRPQTGDPHKAATSGDALDMATLKRYELQIWKRRVHPPLSHIDDLCTHIDALEGYLQRANLKA